MKDFLRKHIQSHGPVDVGQFMGLALGHPRFGYYMTKDPFGRGGDFTTAPEISQMFGEVIGAWAADVWMQMGRPARFTLLECGPGRGTLMADILRAGRGVKGFNDACDVRLLEISPVLKTRQCETLKGYAVRHISSLEEVPGDQPVVAIANEFLDALPVRQLVMTDQGWMERVVTEEFAFGLTPAALQGPKGVSAGDVFEISPAREGFVSDLSALLKKATGAALIIDYGHVKSAAGDTLQAVYKHEYVPVLSHIGDADITSHVDFESVAKAANINIHGPVEQRTFLKSVGIERRAAYLSGKGDKDAMLALKRLTDGDQMGSLFKVMGLSYGENICPAGF